jgi:hypothetical protein
MRSVISRRELFRLRGGVLVVGGNPRVVNQHCANLSPMLSIKQQRFAARQPA